MDSTRRTFLKLLFMGAGAQVLDPDLELWVPGQKTFFLPNFPPGISLAQVISVEMSYLVPRIQELMQRDDLFYQMIRSRQPTSMTGITERGMRVPIIITDGDD
jgi:hypothetical protein